MEERIGGTDRAHERICGGIQEGEQGAQGKEYFFASGTLEMSKITELYSAGAQRLS